MQRDRRDSYTDGWVIVNAYLPAK